MYYVKNPGQPRLAVEDLNPKSYQTVLLVHGWPFSGKIFEYQKSLLIKCGYRVVAPDLRGFGRSDAPHAGYSYDQMADDLFCVVQNLKLNAFTLVGASMGGAVALRYMARYNGYGVKKLALLGAMTPCYTQRPGYNAGVPKETVDRLVEIASRDRPQLCADLADMLFEQPKSDATRRWFCDVALESSGIATIKAAYAMRDEDCRPDMRKIAVPTGIFHGKRDRIVPFDLAVITNEGIAGSILFPFDNSGHGVFYDELDKFNTYFLQFLEL